MVSKRAPNHGLKHDMIVHVKLRQPVLTSTATSASNQPAMRWCHYIGERLLKRVRFEVNGNPLDEYTSHAYNFHREFCVQPNKELGWNRIVGQEIPKPGFIDQPNWERSGVTSAAVTHRFQASVCDGHQTPTGQKDVSEAGDVELFIPLLFWCNL